MPSPLPPWLELIPARPNPNTANTANDPPPPQSFPNPSQTDNLLPFDTMSSTSTPISPEMFALAIKDLPVDTLYSKAAELQNSISHLRDSNEQMKEYADEGDEVCKEAIAENDVVVKRIEERVALLKVEVESRGLIWSAHGANEEEVKVNGHVGVNGEADGDAPVARAPSGRLTDEELRRRMEAQMGGDDEEDGVHL